LASTITLTVPENPAEGSIQEVAGVAGRPLAYSIDDQARGVFTARGIRGDVTISWRPSRVAGVQADARLDVYGTIIVTADELLQEIRADGRFLIRGLGGPVEVFRVLLPPGMRFREAPEPGYTVRVVPPTEQEGDGEERQQVEIRLERPTSSETNVRLVCEVPSHQDDPGGPLTVAKLVDSSLEFTPARFEFPRSARHRGQIDFVMKGDWAVHWAEDPDLPPVEPNGSAASNAQVARFRYFNQNRPLRVSISQKATRISIEPTYDLYVDAQQARLVATFVGRTSGSKAGPLNIRLRGWTAEVVRFADVTSQLPIDLSQVNPLVVQIPVESQASGHFQMRVEARQDLTASVISSTSPLKLWLPTLEASHPTRTTIVVSPATVSVIPAENVSLTPRPLDMQALSPLVTPVIGGGLPTPPPAPAGTVETVQFRYRDRGASEQAIFAGDFKIQPQSIAVTVDTTVTLDRESYGVEQRLSYKVMYEAVRSLELVVPAPLITSDMGRVRILLGDERLTPTFPENVTGTRVPIQVRLPQPTLGALELRVLHPRQPISRLEAGQTASVTVPLVFASTARGTNTTVVGNTLLVNYPEPLRARNTGAAWTVSDVDSQSGKLVLTTAADGADATFDLSLGEQSLIGSTILDQVWVQSWISGAQRRDRAVFSLRTVEPQLRVRVPASATAVTVAIDHRQIDVGLPNERGEIAFTVPRSAAKVTEQHVVEVWYRLPADRRVLGAMRLEAAVLEAVDQVERRYWQLILPRSDLVLWGDQAMSAQLVWQGWSGWGRVPWREQADLERWIGAMRQDPVPPGTHAYLFTSFGAVGPLQVVTMTRTLVLLLASGLALAVGVVWLYFPWFRHPAALVMVAAVLLVVAWLLPELAVLGAQAAALGAALTLVVQMLRLILWRASATSTPVSQRTQWSDSKMTALPPARGEGSSRIATATAPAAVQTSSAESKS
jgi:hypothetical protein